jgi:hypothetical protein
MEVKFQWKATSVLVKMALVESFGIRIKLQFSPASGFYLTIPQTKKSLPEVFVNVIKKRKVIVCSTLEVVHI